MAIDFIPASDHLFRSWARQFVSTLQSAPADYGIQIDEAKNIAQHIVKWEAALDATLKAQAAAKAATETKLDARGTAERAIRAAVRRIQAGHAVTDKHRAALGITVPEEKLAGAVTEISSCPDARVDTSQRFRHVITFRDSLAAGRRSRPPGVCGCEIWLKWQTARSYEEATAAQEPKLLAVAPGNRYIVEHEPEHVGKRVIYLLRWITGKGIKGPWSVPIETTVVG